jgi:TPR repeat protein
MSNRWHLSGPELSLGNWEAQMSRHLGFINVRSVSWQRILAALFLFVPSISNSETYEAKSCFARQDYACALREFSVDAQAGDPVAQLALGLIHAIGLGVPRSAREARTWFTRAADQGNGYAQYNVGLLHYADRIERFKLAAKPR